MLDFTEKCHLRFVAIAHQKRETTLVFGQTNDIPFGQHVFLLVLIPLSVKSRSKKVQLPKDPFGYEEEGHHELAVQTKALTDGLEGEKITIVAQDQKPMGYDD
ncbi:hypothetical protein ACJX0J_017149 [Zea mays]